MGSPLEDNVDLQLFCDDQLSDMEGPPSTPPVREADLFGESDPDSEVDFNPRRGDSFPVAPPVAVQSATIPVVDQSATISASGVC